MSCEPRLVRHEGGSGGPGPSSHASSLHSPACRQSGALDACLASHQQLLAGSGPADFQSLVSTAAAAAAPLAAGLQFYHHAFNGGDGKRCSTLHAVVRTPRGDGSEGFVLMLPLDCRQRAASALAAAAGVTAAAHLRQSGWLAKDAVLLFADAAACTAEESAEVRAGCLGA